MRIIGVYPTLDQPPGKIIVVESPKDCPTDAERIYNYRKSGEYKEADKIRDYHVDVLKRKVCYGKNSVYMLKQGCVVEGYGDESDIQHLKDKALEYLKNKYENTNNLFLVKS